MVSAKGKYARLQAADIVHLDQAQALAAWLKAQMQAVLWEVYDYVLLQQPLLCMAAGAFWATMVAPLCLALVIAPLCAVEILGTARAMLG